MAATVTVKYKTHAGNNKVITADVLFDSTYPAGGESVTASQLGMNRVDFVAPGVSTNGYLCTYDITNSKVKVWYGDNNNASDGPLIENATADISAETVRLRFHGR